MADKYHHGDLPNALRCAAVDVINERGLGNFSLREVARRAGVSHTAPAHHFGDMQGLLTSLAIQGYETLYEVMADALEGRHDPVERLTAIGVAYVELAKTHPAHADVMFRQDVIDPDNDELLACGLDPYVLLHETVQDIIDAEQLDVGIDDAVALCWSAMQGLVTLESKFERIWTTREMASTSTPDMVARFTELIVNGLRGARNDGRPAS